MVCTVEEEVGSIGIGELTSSGRPVDLSTLRLDTRIRLAYSGFHLLARLPARRVSTTKRDLDALDGLNTGDEESSGEDEGSKIGEEEEMS